MIPSQVKNTSSYCFWRYLLLAVQSIIFLHEFFLLQVIIETASGRHEITGRTILNYFRVSICRLFLSRHLKITERGRRKQQALHSIRKRSITGSESQGVTIGIGGRESIELFTSGNTQLVSGAGLIGRYICAFRDGIELENSESTFSSSDMIKLQPMVLHHILFHYLWAKVGLRCYWY